MKHLFSVLAVVLVLAFAQGMPEAPAQDLAHWQADVTQPQPYMLKRVSSADPTGGNADFRSGEHVGNQFAIFDQQIAQFAASAFAVLMRRWRPPALSTLYVPIGFRLPSPSVPDGRAA